MSSADEIVSIVDREDNVIDEVPRHVMRSQSLRHRVTYIFVFDSSGRLYVQKRTSTKDLYPGYFDLAAGGVVCAGESYEASAARAAAALACVTDSEISLGAWQYPQTKIPSTFVSTGVSNGSFVLKKPYSFNSKPKIFARTLLPSLGIKAGQSTIKSV